MCGIFGVVGRELSSYALERALEMLRHRGPDGQGLFTDRSSKLTLAHTRLTVIDLETGAQPLQSADGSIVLAANGEIYDFERIRRSLETKGYRFKTKSDSEVIVYLYQEYGLGCFEHLRGEFAFLLYDKTRRRLIAARDRFGIKPLYFARLDPGFVFASEMKAIFASGLVKAKLDVVALDPLRDQDPKNIRFLFEAIEHVPPASYVTVDLDTLDVRTTRYWSAEIPADAAGPVTEADGGTPETAARKVLEELEEAVRLRLRADVPVGLYLSGGIDSAFVGALMKRNLKSPLHSFSISFAGSGRNEQEFAHRASEEIGTVHHELTVTKQMLWDNLEECLWHSELPFATLAPVGKFLLSEEARKHVTVVLTGEGADEVFLGYRSFFKRAIADTHHSRRSISTQARRLKLTRLGAEAAHRLSLLLFVKPHRGRLAKARARSEVEQGAAWPVINAVQEARIAAMPLDILCFLGDREEMAHSLEARVPFLDHKLYDVAKSIPVDFKMRGGLEKAVLRDAAKGLLPDEIRLRRKTGFMLTSEAVDLFGADRYASTRLHEHLSRQAFENAGVYSYRTYRLITVLARVPPWLPALRRLRKNANKILMYMMQTHMLHDMFVANPIWAQSIPRGPKALPAKRVRAERSRAAA